jgi:hypothetical protein
MFPAYFVFPQVLEACEMQRRQLQEREASLVRDSLVPYLAFALVKKKWNLFCHFKASGRGMPVRSLVRLVDRKDGNAVFTRGPSMRLGGGPGRPSYLPSGTAATAEDLASFMGEEVHISGHLQCGEHEWKIIRFLCQFLFDSSLPKQPHSADERKGFALSAMKHAFGLQIIPKWELVARHVYRKFKVKELDAHAFWTQLFTVNGRKRRIFKVVNPNQRQLIPEEEPWPL